jgi:2-aminoethylphosphonate-pyruvate transaminase
MILLNPGPVNVSERVRQALLRPDICHRESEFSDLLGRIQQKLLAAFVPGAESDYVAVLLTGSGTAAVESAVMSCLPMGKRMLVLNNGVYGERLSSMIGLHRLGVSELKSEWHIKPDPERVRLALRQHPEVHAVSMVHHETTTGLINPVKEIAEVVDSLNRVFVLDSVSGLAGEPIDIAGSHIYMVAGTAGKVHSGLSRRLVRPGAQGVFGADAQISEAILVFDPLTHYVDEQGKGDRARSRRPCRCTTRLRRRWNELLAEGVDQPLSTAISAHGGRGFASGWRAWGCKPFLPADSAVEYDYRLPSACRP